MRKKNGEGSGAAQQRVVLGSFIWLPVSLRKDGQLERKMAHWVNVSLEIEEGIEVELPEAGENVQEMGGRHVTGGDRRQTELFGSYGGQEPQEAGTLPKEAPEKEEEGCVSEDDRQSHGSLTSQSTLKTQSWGSGTAPLPSQQRTTGSIPLSSRSHLISPPRQLEPRGTSRRYRTSKAPPTDSDES